MSNPTIETKISLPASLLEAIDKVVLQGKANSRDEFIMRAIRRELAALNRVEIDAAFARMANDAEYQAEALQIAEEFAISDWEAWQIGESERRAKIDAELAEMASDPEYQAEVLQMEAEFATASWEALQLAESEE